MQSPNQPTKAFNLFLSLMLISAIVLAGFQFQKFLETKTDEGLYLETKKKEADELTKAWNDLNSKLEIENQKFGFGTIIKEQKLVFGDNSTKVFSLKINTNFGELGFDLDSKIAPKNVENLVRLVDRGYYNQNIFHRITSQKSFRVIQSGDRENGDGTGGRSAYYINKDNLNLIIDEVWSSEPQFNSEGRITNQPTFASQGILENFDLATGVVKYPKGTLAIANRGNATNSSQFFVVLEDSIIPANYTVVGRTGNFEVLDKISSEVKVKQTSQENFDQIKKNNPDKVEESAITDGFPEPSLYIQEAKIEIKK